MSKKVCAPGLIVLLSAICLTSIASAQTSWQRTYGGTNDDYGNSVQQTSDGGYIIAGTTWSFGADSGDIYLIKTNAQGDTLWARMCVGPGYCEGLSGQQTTDGGYVITGYVFYSGDGHQDVYLTKTNASGDTLWTRTYEWGGYECGLSVQQTTDGGYIIAGYAEQDSGDVYLVKTNSHGDLLWDNVYGGSSSEEGVSVQQTTDGGYIIAGDVLVSAGDWNFDVYLIKTNSQGDTLWTRAYGGAKEDRSSSVQQTSDGGYIIVGYTHSFGAGGADVYLIKTNASGDTLWTKTYGGTSDDGGSSVRQTADGGYIIAGSTHSFGPGTPDCENVYLIKTDSLGNVGIEEPLKQHPARPTSFLVQPNPFTSFARVPGHETDVFALSDVTGRQVAICKGCRVGEGLRPGVYFMSPIGLRAGKAATATIVKVAF